MAKYLRNGDLSEHQIQKTVIQWVKLNPNLRKHIFSIPNESATSATYGRKLKERGLRAGASDLFIALARHKYHGCFLELKSASGTLSEAQRAFLVDMEQAGYFATVCWSIDETIDTIKWYAGV